MADGSEVSYGAVSGDVTTSAKLLVGARSRRDTVIIQNVHASNILYLGSDSSVTASNGLRLGAGESISLPTRGDVYGIASAASTTVRYFEVY